MISSTTRWQEESEVEQGQRGRVQTDLGAGGRSAAFASMRDRGSNSRTGVARSELHAGEGTSKCWRKRVGLDALEDERDALSAADARGDDAVLLLQTVQVVHNVRGDARPGGAERVAES